MIKSGNLFITIFLCKTKPNLSPIFKEILANSISCLLFSRFTQELYRGFFTGFDSNRQLN